MKAIVVRQPWATLIALGVKTIETRPGPPNGPMRPDGVRGLPGCTLERGERVAIVAGAGIEPGFFPVANVEHFGGPIKSREWRLPNGHHLPAIEGVAFPRGAVVCTVTVDDAGPVFNFGTEPPSSLSYFRRAVARGDGGEMLLARFPAVGPVENRTDQLPLGDFTPGRWGWLLGDVQPCVPVPCKGRQGVFVLPDDVAEKVG